MKNLIPLFALIMTLNLTAQVGINTTAPNSLLDIRSSNEATPTNTDGLIIPKVDEFPLTNPTVAQDGMMVYATGNGTPTKGFYYWDNGGMSWVAVSGSSGATKIDELSDGKSEVSGSSVFLGLNSGTNDDDGNSNVGLGYNAMTSNTSGNSNVALGNEAMSNNTTGFQNVAVGRDALRDNIDGDRNSAFGYDALGANTTGGWNTALGNIALFSNTSGDRNTAVGFRSLGSNTTGSNNTSFGYQALLSSTGTSNTAVGYYAGRLNVSGASNVFLGNSAGHDVLGSNNIMIGNQAGYNETGSNKLYIENSLTTTPLIYATFDTNEVGINWDSSVNLPNTLSVNGNASKSTAGSWLANSDRRLKKNIETITPKSALEKITSLRGVAYEWNDTQTGIERPTETQYGFIAQEIMEVFPEKVIEDGQGFYQTAYGDYDAFFVQAIKELKLQLQEKDLEIEKLKKALEISNESLTEKMNTLEAKLNLLENTFRGTTN